MEIPNSVRYFQRLNEIVKELAKKVGSEKKGEKMKKCCENCIHFPILTLDDTRWKILVYDQCLTAGFTDVCEKWEAIDAPTDTSTDT